MSEHEEMENVVAAWVLGATDPDEAERVAAHLETCAICRATVARLRTVVDAIPLSVEEVEPPPQLRQRILAAAAATPQTAAAPDRTGAPIVSITRRRPRIAVRPGRVPFAAAAAVAVIALVGGLVVGDIVSRSTPPTQAGQVARFSLAGHDSMAGASASVVDLKSDGIAFVDFSGLPALAPGKVYELWLIGPSNRVDAAAVFIPEGNGSKVVVVSRPLAGYTTMAVTTEQGPSGVAAPTQQPQLAGTVA
jgi:anti-sigma-K factor RskA